MALRLSALAAAAASLLGVAGSARAAEVQLNPVVISLAPAARSAIVTVRNQGAETVRFELQARSWDESPAGQMILGPTSDLAVYPPVLTLGPGEERNVRVGVASPKAFGNVERTYRVFLQELPPPEEPGGAAQVRVLSRLGLPVFLAPARPSEKVSIQGLATSAGQVTFRLVNEGTVHVRPSSVKVTGRAADGAAAFEVELPAWYLLAGGTRDFTAAIPAGDCRKARAIEVAVDVSHAPLAARLDAPPACSP